MSDREVSVSVGRMAVSGLCTSLVGIGLSRFAYTPLLPAVIAAHWFAPSAAAYLGAANLAGYLAGASLAQPLADRISAVATIRAMMLVATAAFFGCAFPLSFSWFFAWRLLSGISGGALMVLAAPTILPFVPPPRRGLVTGIIFVGVGCGIVASATLVPALLALGLSRTWEGLGAVALVLSVIAWHGWPAPAPRRTPAQTGARPRKTSARSRALAALPLEYALAAAGFVAHMVFLVDFVARGLGEGLAAGAGYWALFGLGAAVGPVIAGSIADRTGFGVALRYTFLVQAAAVGLLTLAASSVTLIISSVIVGALVPGIVPLVVGRIHELTHGDADRQKAAWSICVTAFAVGQAGAGYGLSFVFAQTGGAYTVLFAIGAAALCLAFALDVAVAVLGRRIGARLIPQPVRVVIPPDD